MNKHDRQHIKDRLDRWYWWVKLHDVEATMVSILIVGIIVGIIVEMVASRW